MTTEADLLSDIDPVLLRRGDPNVSEATSPLWVYVAGPMRGIAEFNFPAFEEATEQLRSRGYKVISPAEQDLGRGFDPTGLTGNEDLSSLGFDLREALIADLNHIAFECDAICLLPGWEDSKGARAELALAVALGLSAGTLASFASGTLIPAQDFADSLRTQDDIRHQFEAMTEREYLTGDLSTHVCGSAWFDRSICPDPCGSMHSYCDTCGKRQDPCAHDRQTQGGEVRVTSGTGGQKGKKLARFELIPTRPWWAVSELYGYGASKYQEARNWELGYDWSLSYAALQRHANLFWSRENDDPETGLPHLAAVVFHALALMEYRTTHPEFDDRPGQ